MILVDGVSKGFGGHQALDAVHFRAADAQITGLLGPNGSGKTTCLRVMYGLLHADAGEVYVDGVSVSHHPLVVRRQLGVLPDSIGLYARLTALENIVYFARLQGMSRSAADVAARHWLARLDISHLSHRRAHGFSRGERIRVAMARALVHDPHNLLLDEPGNGLDVASLRILRDVLVDIRSEGRCVVLSTHAMHDVSQLCDQVAILAGGKLIALGTPAELQRRVRQDSLEDAFVSLVQAACASNRPESALP